MPKTKRVEPLPCVCGERAECIQVNDVFFQVECVATQSKKIEHGIMCWRGPMAPTRRGAIGLWDERMCEEAPDDKG